MKQNKKITNFLLLAGLLGLLFPLGIQAQYSGGIGKGDARGSYMNYTYNGSWSPENPNGFTTGEKTVNIIYVESGTTTLASATNAKRVEISPGAALDATSLTLTDSILIMADATGYGMYKGSQQNVRIQQYVANAGWHNMALPVSGNLSQFGSVNTAVHPNARNIYTWDETNSSWADPVGAGDGSQVANSPGTGYMVYVGTNGVASAASAVEVRGAMLTSATPSVSNAGTSNNANQDGWNLIANPFSCGLDFTQLSLTDVVNSFSIWDPATSQYKDYSGLVGDIASGVIAPMQAFWVKADGNSPSVGSMEMASDGTVGSSPTFYKSQNTIADRLFVAAYQGSQPHKQDEVLIAMVAGSGDGLDPQWDAPSRINGGSMPTLMTVAQGDQLSHNAIDYSPNHLRSKALPLRFVSSQQGEIYFLALHDSLLTNAYQVELEDLKLRKRHDLTLQPYKFVHDANAEYRFVLHLTPVSTVSEGHSHAPISQGGFGYGINGGQLVLKLDRPVEEVEGRLLNLNGQQVMRVRYPAGVEEYAVGVDQLASGVYLLQWKSSQGEEVHKILLP